jgi:deferrochelatase/peroxidase EfeB
MSQCPFSFARPSRRGFLAAAGGLVAGSGAMLGGAHATSADDGKDPGAPPAAESFWGAHQGGIISPAQGHTYFAAFDLVTGKRDDVVKLLRAWTEAAARLSRGQPAAPIGQDLSQAAGDSGEALDLPSARLTVTFGFAATLFTKDGKDRYGLASRRPEALIDMPRFNGEQLVPERSGGDLSVQACADDPQVVFHAVRQLARMAYGVAELRWTQTGFAGDPAKGTPRNLMGFRDGTQQPGIPVKGAATPPGPAGRDAAVWAGAEGPAWMQGGSYMVVRKIRIALEHWDRTEVDFQEEVIGRHKYSGAPLGKQNEFDALDLEAVDKDGNPLIPDTAHVRLATAASNDGAQILRRAYQYNDGTNLTAERWPPWRQGLEYDAGLLFICYQRDPRAGFVKIFDPMSKMDALNQFSTHVSSGLFACPAGVTQGGFVGQGLFETA